MLTRKAESVSLLAWEGRIEPLMADLCTMC